MIIDAPRTATGQEVDRHQNRLRAVRGLAVNALPSGESGETEDEQEMRGDPVDVLNWLATISSDDCRPAGSFCGAEAAPIHRKSAISMRHLLEFGAAEGTRTPDPIITNDVLYQLSYSGLVTRRITASFETV